MKKDTNKQFYSNYWNENMIDYLNNSSGSRWFKYLLNELLKEIPKNKVSSAADIGCGVGNKTAQIAEYFSKAEVTGFDFSEPGIKTANNYYKIKNLSFIAGDVTKVKAKNNYDLISAFELLEHIKDWKALADSLIKINNQYFIISVPVGRMRPYEKHIGHFRNYKRGEIEKFMESRGYVTVKTFYAGFPFYSPIIRELSNIFYKSYDQPQEKMSFVSKRIHDVWYFLFRYCSLKHKGDTYIGLFRKVK